MTVAKERHAWAIIRVKMLFNQTWQSTPYRRNDDVKPVYRRLMVPGFKRDKHRMAGEGAHRLPSALEEGQQLSLGGQPASAAAVGGGSRLDGRVAKLGVHAMGCVAAHEVEVAGIYRPALPALVPLLARGSVLRLHRYTWPLQMIFAC
eukprot:scaffold25660_cov33-Prasinocladus_malaysianus.AAC.1